MGWLKRFLGSYGGSAPRLSARRVTVKDPLVVHSPKIGYFNLMGPAGESLVDEDKRALQHLFASSDESSETPPICNVLMIYAQVGEDGKIAGSADGLREMIRDSTAVVAVVASENGPKGLIAAAKKTGYGQANLVMTIGRKGSKFPTFFARLFEKMWNGITMPVAWVELAPQGGAAVHNVPGTIFSAEISHILFRK